MTDKDSARRFGDKRAREIPHESAKCSRFIKSKNRQCARWAVVGGTTCPVHGGNGNMQVRAQQRALAQNDVLARLKGGRIIDDPDSELQRIAGELVEFGDIAAERMAAIQEWTHTDRHGVEAESALVSIYTKARKDAYELLVKQSKLQQGQQRLLIDRARAIAVIERMRLMGERLRFSPQQWAAFDSTAREVFELEGQKE